MRFIIGLIFGFTGGLIMSQSKRFQCYGINTDAELTASIEVAVNLFGLNADKDDLRNLLIETAIAESNYGNAIYDNKRGFGYGAFQFDKIGMKQALSVVESKGLGNRIKIASLYDSDLTVKNYLNVYNDFQLKSILQAILCRMYYLGIKEPIPSTLEGRARYWKKYYNSELGAGTPAKYIARVESFYSKNGKV